MIFRVFAAALAAGVLAAVLITGLQELLTTPMILEAETYEAAGPAGSANGEWAPKDGIERLLYTLLANLGTATGFALLLVVGLTFDLKSAGAERGVLLGALGFSAFSLAPGLGLAPELPGMLAADLRARQTWWLVTAFLSAGGLGLLVFGKATVLKAIGLVVLVLPHLWGAPHGVGESLVPAELAARYSAAAITLSAVFWVMIGYFSGLFFKRQGEKTNIRYQ